MAPPGSKSERTAALFLLGALVFNPPLLGIFNLPAMVFGVPLLYVWLFGAWVALVVALGLAIEAREEAEAPPYRPED